MTRNLTASVLALSIAMSSLSAAPVQAAENKELGRFIAGALTLLLISKAIQNGKKPQQNVSRSNSWPTTYPVKKSKRSKKRLPSECYFRMRADHGTRGVYGKICLGEFMRRADRLPRVCEERIRIRYGRRANIYDARCLRTHGYRTEARRR